MFSEGREEVNDKECAGCPSTSTTDKIIDEMKKIVLTNRRIIVREFADDLNISNGSCHPIFTNNLAMRRVATKFVPKFLNFDQKPYPINIDKELLDSVRNDPNLLQRITTDDESWIYVFTSLHQCLCLLLTCSGVRHTLRRLRLLVKRIFSSW